MTAHTSQLGPKVALTGRIARLPPPLSWGNVRRRVGPRWVGAQVLRVGDEPVTWPSR